MRWAYKLLLVVLLGSCSDSEELGEINEVETDGYLISIDNNYVGSLTVETRCHGEEASNECSYWEQSACISEATSRVPRCYNRRFLEDDSAPNFRSVDQNELTSTDASTKLTEHFVKLDLNLSRYLDAQEGIRAEVETKCGLSDSWKKINSEASIENVSFLYLPAFLSSKSGRRYVLEVGLEEPWALNLTRLFESSIREVSLGDDIVQLSPLSSLELLQEYCERAYDEAPEGGFRNRYASTILDEVYSHQLMNKVADNAYTRSSLPLSMEARK